MALASSSARRTPPARNTTADSSMDGIRMTVSGLAGAEDRCLAQYYPARQTERQGFTVRQCALMIFSWRIAGEAATTPLDSDSTAPLDPRPFFANNQIIYPKQRI